MITWKILEVVSVNDAIDYVKYRATITEGDLKVETEGNCHLTLSEEVVFKDLIEPELIEYVKRFYIQNDVNSIESNLSQQLEYLKKNTSTTPPWHVETFKVEF